MCKWPVDEFDEFDFCYKFELKSELERLATEHTVIDNYGNDFVPMWKVKAILKKLECNRNADV